MFLANGQPEEAFKRIESAENRLTGFNSAYRQFADQVKSSQRPDWPARVNLVQRLLQLTWIREAENQARALTEEAPNAAFLWSLLGQVLVTRGQAEEARGCYEKALQLDPEYIGVHQYLADLAWKFNHDLAAARDRLVQMLKASPEPENPFFLPMYVQLGRAYDESGQSDQAIETYRKALSIDASNFMALNNLAYLYIELDRLDEALTYAERARDLNPYNGAILDTLGWIYYLKGRHPEALEALQLASALLPFEPTIQFHLGKSLMISGREEAALQAFQRSLLLGRHSRQEEAGSAERLEAPSAR
jgi:tetratricopeptide (TPR) repeat protein